jgi:hypothetical protein
VDAFRSGGWTEAVEAAAFCFLSLLGIGAVLVVAAKLENPALGTGAGPLEALSAIVVLGLAGIGVTLDLGRLSIAALPLGVVVVFAGVVSWVARTTVQKRRVADGKAAVLDGMKLAVPLGVICLLAALLFRVGRSEDAVRAQPAMAWLVSSLWGALFGALGGLRWSGSLGWNARDLLARIQLRSRSWYEGLVAGGAMLAVTAVLSAAALLLIMIVGLMRGHPEAGITAGDAVSGLVYFAAFLPNLVVLVATFALGAPVEVGARVSFGGRPIGGFESFSLLGLGGPSPGGAALLLLLIPLVACLFGGFVARRHSSMPGRFTEVLGTAAVVYATTWLVLGWLSSARIGVGVLGRGVGRLAPGAGAAFLVALLWAGVVGWLGWKLAERVGPGAAAPERPARRR